MTATRTAPRRTSRLPLLVGALGLGLVATSVVAMTADRATGAGPVSDGSDWGGQGTLGSSSAVTARWDNADTPAASVVHRDGRQALPHTAGKTYDDVNRSALTAYADHFGPDNGFGGLRVSLSQSTQLVNQSVTVSFSGADPDLPGTGAASRSYFQVFQCWGAMGVDGRPDPAATEPDPSTCQVGATGPDSVGGSKRREYRYVAGDPLVRGGDWDPYFTAPASGAREVPFVAIDGQRSGSNLDNTNTFFNATTTNELSHVVLPASGATERRFELQTGTESQGLGCGYRSDSPSTPTCWLVVVPRVQDVLENLGPTSPSVWAQRLQFRLEFRDAVSTCPGGQARSLVGGSEMLADAAAAWAPGVCDAEQVTLGYSRFGDEVARNQYLTGANSAIVTTRPLRAGVAAVHVPLTLAAPVVAHNIDYYPLCDDPTLPMGEIATDAGARECGYADLAALRADLARRGQPIRDLRLNARLVAKLLTQSYSDAVLTCNEGCGAKPAWAGRRPANLFADPEFRTLNPQLHLPASAGNGPSDLLVEAMRSDGAAEVWRWMLADPAAASFLAGCPDEQGVFVNPFFSTRTYAGCEFRATAYEQEAAAARQGSETPSGFVAAPMSYPPFGSPYPLPQWQQRTSEGTTPYTLVDHFPRTDHMQIAARDVAIGYKPRNSEWCQTRLDQSCVPAPGKWKDPKKPQAFGERQMLALTDTPSAARYQLPTAALCSTAHECVSANTASLQQAATLFEQTGVPGVVGPATAAGYAAGAYPMTLPVYAAVRPSLAAADRHAYADAFAFVTGRGQQPGFAAGDLPPGYAPLTPALRERAAAAIAALRAGVPVEEEDEARPTKSPKPTESPTAAATPTETDPGAASDSSGPAAAPEASAPPSVSPPAAAPAPTGTATEAASVPVSAGTESWPGYTLALGLALALGAGVAGPLLRARTRWRLR
jgi:hypothetical protein